MSSSGIVGAAVNTGIRIRLARHGCTNRPFFHLVVAHRLKKRDIEHLDQVGTFDPLPNDRNEKYVSLNYERLKYWIANGAQPSKTVSKLLGLAGFLPLHPMLHITADRARKQRNTTAEDN